MKPHKQRSLSRSLIWALSASLFLPLTVHGLEPEVVESRAIHEVERYKRLSLFVSSEFSMLKSASSSLLGMGPRLSALYALSPKWALNFGIAQAISLSGGLSALYTAVNLHASYALTGNLLSGDRELQYEGQKFMSYRRAKKPALILSGGLEQYLLNATTSVVSGSGAGLSLLYTFPFASLQANVGLRSAYLLYSSNTLMVLGVVGGLNWIF